MTDEPTIIVVDDDAGIRESLQGLLRSVGHGARTPNHMCSRGNMVFKPKYNY